MERPASQGARPVCSAQSARSGEQVCSAMRFQGLDMESYVLDWANLLLRWVHVITAIAWIGSSFYFVFLDNNLLKPTSADLLEKGVDGDRKSTRLNSSHI